MASWEDEDPVQDPVQDAVQGDTLDLTEDDLALSMVPSLTHTSAQETCATLVLYARLDFEELCLLVVAWFSQGGSL